MLTSSTSSENSFELIANPTAAAAENSSLKTDSKIPIIPCCDRCIPNQETGAHPQEEMVVCKECLIFLCGKHLQAHKEDRFTFQHSIMPVSSLDTQADLNDSLKLNRQVLLHAKTCQLHSPLVADLFCLTCDEVVCQKCPFAEKHASHTNSIRSITEVLPTSLTILKSISTESEVILEKGKQELEKIEELLSSLEKNASEITAKLEGDRGRILEKVEQDFKTQSQLVSNLFAEKREVLSKKRKILFEEVVEKNEEIMGKSEMVSHSQNPFQVALSANRFQNSLKKAQEIVGNWKEFGIEDDSFLSLEEQPQIASFFKFSSGSLNLEFKISTAAYESSNSGYQNINCKFLVPPGKGIVTDWEKYWPTTWNLRLSFLSECKFCSRNGIPNITHQSAPLEINVKVLVNEEPSQYLFTMDFPYLSHNPCDLSNLKITIV